MSCLLGIGHPHLRASQRTAIPYYSLPAHRGYWTRSNCTHWGQRGSYLAGTLWVCWEFLSNLLPLYPVGKLRVLLKLTHHFDLNVIWAPLPPVTVSVIILVLKALFVQSFPFISLQFLMVLWTFLTFHTFQTFDTWIAQAINTRRRSLLPLGIDHHILPLFLAHVPYRCLIHLVSSMSDPHLKPVESLFHFKVRGRTLLLNKAKGWVHQRAGYVMPCSSGTALATQIDVFIWITGTALYATDGDPIICPYM